MQWIQTLVRIIHFADTTDQDTIKSLVLSKVDDEKWQKGGNAIDIHQQKKYGPVPAESSFTVIHLLQYMGLDEQADFYSSRLHELVGPLQHSEG